MSDNQIPGGLGQKLYVYRTLPYALLILLLLVGVFLLGWNIVTSFFPGPQFDAPRPLAIGMGGALLLAGVGVLGFFVLAFLRSTVNLEDDGLRVRNWRERITFIPWPAVIRVISAHRYNRDMWAQYLRIEYQTDRREGEELFLISGRPLYRVNAAEIRSQLIERCRLSQHRKASRNWGFNQEEVWEQEDD